LSNLKKDLFKDILIKSDQKKDLLGDGFRVSKIFSKEKLLKAC